MVHSERTTSETFYCCHKIFFPSLCLCPSSLCLLPSAGHSDSVSGYFSFICFSLFVIAFSFPLSGDRFWLCQTCKGPDLDTVWHPRISSPRDYSQQGEPPWFPSVSCELSAVFRFKTTYSAFKQTMISTCCTKINHVTTITMLIWFGTIVSHAFCYCRNIDSKVKVFLWSYQPEEMVLGVLMLVTWSFSKHLGLRSIYRAYTTQMFLKERILCEMHFCLFNIGVPCV